MAWVPGMSWPGTPGGALSPAWGGYTRLYVRAQIAPGTQLHVGPHPADRLNAGNVYGPVTASPTQSLWVDLSCDVLDLTVDHGATRAEGAFSRAEASTVTVTLYDPARVYDPSNLDSPYVLKGASRFIPGLPVEVVAEVVTNPTTSTVTRYVLFTGAVDYWREPWATNPADRRAKFTASDKTKYLASLNWPEQSPVGAGDTVTQRIARIAAYFALPFPVVATGASTRTLAATTLAQSAWELLNRTIDDEIGYVYVQHTNTGPVLRWVNREQWFPTTVTPVLVLGCDVPAVDALDVITAVQLAGIDEQLRNVVYASRTGGTQQTARAQSSIDKYGGYERDYKRTDLGLATDAQVAEWAQAIISLYAYPTPVPVSVTLHPPAGEAQPWAAWAKILGVVEVTDPVRVVWEPPDGAGSRVDVIVRVLGERHEITRDSWAVTWSTVGFVTRGKTLHAGPHALDRLDDGNVYAYAHT